jgi:hypothetical protein
LMEKVFFFTFKYKVKNHFLNQITKLNTAGILINYK